MPFDPTTKRAEAIVRRGGVEIHIVKGAPQVVGALLGVKSDFAAAAELLAADGARVLAVASGPAGQLGLAGLISFTDPIRDDSKTLVKTLRSRGVRVVLVTGDGAATARAVGRVLGIGDRVCGHEEAARDALSCDVIAGVLPEDKLRVVRALQRTGAVVGMTGDGVNDAPALKQAEIGIAVESATDVAKAAASIVLTRPGLEGVLAAVETGRRIYQRMLTYTINKIVKTIEVALFLSIGFVLTGELVTSPRLILLLLFTNDFVTMSLAGDRVTGSAEPERWNVRFLVTAALWLGVAWVVFSLAVFFVGRDVVRLPHASVQTLSFLVLVFGGQANVYSVRERRRFWQSTPSPW
ncbi:MAG TPA: HAD-IC family P-type ATPase, partial [Candidatus Tumulicola sp.]|nr:HAD-IC family P-type ATPase [Candidatus Tumulicola sp.]